MRLYAVSKLTIYERCCCNIGRHIGIYLCRYIYLIFVAFTDEESEEKFYFTDQFIFMMMLMHCVTICSMHNVHCTHVEWSAAPLTALDSGDSAR